MAIFFNFQTKSSHLHPQQVENCGSNSRLVVDEDDNGKFRLETVNYQIPILGMVHVFLGQFSTNLKEILQSLFSRTSETTLKINA